MPTPRKPRARKREDFNGKAAAHQRYYTSDKERVPGATTVLNMLNKPALVGWANRLGLDGIDVNKYRDEAAAIGTSAHYLIECELAEREPDLQHFTPAQLARAQWSLDQWHAWKRHRAIVVEASELQLVSDTHRYGGTLDFYGTVDGEYELLDFKTSGQIYPEHKIQVSSYAKLLIEHKYRVRRVRVLQIGRNEDEGFSEHVLSRTDLKIGWEIFQHALAIYRLMPGLKGKR